MTCAKLFFFSYAGHGRSVAFIFSIDIQQCTKFLTISHNLYDIYDKITILCLGDTFSTTLDISWKDDIQYWRRTSKKILFSYNRAAKTTVTIIDDSLPIQDTITVFFQRKTTYPSARVFPVLNLSHFNIIFFPYDDFFTLFPGTVRFRFSTFYTWSRWFDSTLQHFLLWIFFLHRHAN